MKKILISIILLSLLGCEAYVQPSLLTLSGTYVIDEISIYSETNSLNLNLGWGDSLVNSGGGNWNPLLDNDTLFLGQTRFEIGYDKIYLYKNNIAQYDTFVYYSTRQFDITPYEYNYLSFDYNGYRTFKILEDGTESLSLGVEGENYNGEIHLLRIDP